MDVLRIKDVSLLVMDTSLSVDERGKCTVEVIVGSESWVQCLPEATTCIYDLNPPQSIGAFGTVLCAISDTYNDLLIAQSR